MRTHIATGGTALHRLPRLKRRQSLLLRKLEARFALSPIAFELSLPDGECHRYGAGRPEFRVTARSDEAFATLASLDLGSIAEAYMAEAFDVEGNLLTMYELRRYLSDGHPLHYLWRFVQPLVLGQVKTNARAIQTHYDLEAGFYLAFLGGLRCYTQGIFSDACETLEDAQRRKIDYCIEACALGPGSHVLEVGPGWGAFAEHVATRGIRLTAVTNSVKSHEYMQGLGRRLGASWEIVLGDILEHRPRDRYDAIVGMGIMEHLPDYATVLGKFAEILKPGGRVYIDASASRTKYAASSFIYRYIYPGNHSFFVLHDFLAAVAQTPFMVRDIHDDRVSYFLTFTHWARNLEANRQRVVREFGEREYRRFHLYLWGSAHCFLTDTLQCYRLVLARPDARPSWEVVRDRETAARTATVRSVARASA